MQAFVPCYCQRGKSKGRNVTLCRWWLENNKSVIWKRQRIETYVLCCFIGTDNEEWVMGYWWRTEVNCTCVIDSLKMVILSGNLQKRCRIQRVDTDKYSRWTLKAERKESIWLFTVVHRDAGAMPYHVQENEILCAWKGGVPAIPLPSRRYRWQF